MPHLIDTQYREEFLGAKVGDTISIRRRFVPTVSEYNGSTITVQDLTETSVPFQLEKHFDCSFKITSKQRTLSLEDLSKQVIAPAVLAMAEKIDNYICGKLTDIPGAAGPSSSAPGDLIDDLASMALVEESANNLRFPNAPRYMVVSPRQKATLMGVDSFVEVDKSGTSDALRKALIRQTMGFDIYMSQNVPTTTFTSGTQTAAVVNGALSAGATSIACDGGAVATGTLKEGDILDLAGYGPVTVAANVTFSGSAATVTIKEPLRTGVADNTVVTVYDGGGNTRACHGAIFHPSAMALVSVPLEPAMSVSSETIVDDLTKMAIRVTTDWDRDTKADVMSLDVLIGAKVIDGRLCRQIIGNV
jgi:hypothetical protein